MKDLEDPSEMEKPETNREHQRLIQERIDKENKKVRQKKVDLIRKSFEVQTRDKFLQSGKYKFNDWKSSIQSSK